MQESASWKRRIWFGLGMVSLFISTLVWLVFLFQLRDAIEIGQGKPEAWEIIAVDLIYGALPIGAGILGIGIYIIKHGRKVQVAETTPGPEPMYKGQPGVKRAIVFAIVALVLGTFSCTALVSDPGPGESYATQVVMAGLLFLIWGLVTGYFNPRLWPVSGVIALSAFIWILLALGVAFGGGYLGSVLRRNSVILSLFRRK